MGPRAYRSTAPLEVLATSLAMGLSYNELEWLWRELARRAEEKRRKECKEVGEPSVLADNRDAWQPGRRKRAHGMV